MKKVHALDAVCGTDLCPRDKWVLTYLIQRMQSKTGFVCWPSEQVIANCTGYNRSTVRVALASLIKHGLLIRAGEVKSSRGGSPVQKYMLDVEALQVASAGALNTPSVALPHTEDPQCGTTQQSSVGLATPQCGTTRHELLIGITKVNDSLNTPSQPAAVEVMDPPSKEVATTPKSNPKSAARRSGEYSPEFEEFWDLAYRREGKGAAAAAYAKALKRIDRGTLLTAWSLVNEYWFAVKKERRFVPHPSTWLNEGRWDDDPPQPEPVKMNPFEEMIRREKQRRESTGLVDGWAGTLLVQEVGQ